MPVCEKKGKHLTIARAKQRSGGEMVLILAVLLTSLGAQLRLSPVSGADWPQIHGPNRNGVAADEQIDSTPSPRWRFPVGQGYAGPAVVDSVVYLFHRVGNVERLDALDLDTGKRLWKVDFDATYRGGINPDSGPRCVPLVHQDRIILFGAAGVAHAVDRKTGAKLWTRDLYGDYRGQEGYFGAGSTPVAVDDRVLFNVGGRPSAGLVALSLSNGKTLWSSTDEGASYSSPAVASVRGNPSVVFLTRYNAVAVNPQNGKVAFRFPFGRRGPTVNAATPIVIQDRLFLTSSYQVGAALLNLKAPDQAIWENDRSLSSQYNTPVAKDDFLYGIHGREDVGSADLRCIETGTGRVVWSQPNFGVANLILVGDQLVAITNEGELIIAKASPSQYSEIGRYRVSKHSTRALPALSQGRLLVRDNQGDEGELICLDLRP